MQPLKLPPDLDPYAPDTPDKLNWFERIPERLPKIFFCPNSNTIKAVDLVEQQLMEREQPDPQRWGDSTEKIEIGQRICRALKKEFCWPNSYFLPEDPFELATLSTDGLVIVEFIMSLEEEFDIHKEHMDNIILEIQNLGEAATLGDLADRILEKCKLPDEERSRKKKRKV